MKHIDEFRDAKIAKLIAGNIRAETGGGRDYRFMEFCGGHTHTIFRYSIPKILPSNVHMVHGPGCPVCVLPAGKIDNAIELVSKYDVILCSYGDMARVPGSNGMSLLKIKSSGCDVRVVYSIADALNIALENPAREVVFFAIGFETTAPPTTVAIKEAAKLKLKNFTVFCNHLVTPAAIQNILQSREIRRLGVIPIDGFIGPGHVSTVIGTQPYEYFAREFCRPVVVAGFEPLDILQAILMLVRQINEGRAVVENEYTRAVTRDGNLKAKSLAAEVFELRRSFEWRGLGLVPYSALKIKDKYCDYDAEVRFSIPYRPIKDNKACECGAILRGVKTPSDCKLFGTVCTPENPVGACMVSSEGACAAYYNYDRFNLSA